MCLTTKINLKSRSFFSFPDEIFKNIFCFYNVYLHGTGVPNKMPMTCADPTRRLYVALHAVSAQKLIYAEVLRTRTRDYNEKN